MKTAAEILDLVQANMDELPVSKKSHIQIMNMLAQLKKQFEAEEAEESKEKSDDK